MLQVALLAIAVLLCASCASHTGNPAVAKAHTGYVDFYSRGQPALSWEIKRWDSKAGAFKTVFYKLAPLEDNVLRLESPPGQQRFRVSFLNRVVEAPATVEVQVNEGMVTPVKIELVPLTPTSVVSRTEQVGPNVQGAGRKTQYSTQAGTVDRIVALPQSAVPYRLKEQTPHPP